MAACYGTGRITIITMLVLVPRIAPIPFRIIMLKKNVCWLISLLSNPTALLAGRSSCWCWHGAGLHIHYTAYIYIRSHMLYSLAIYYGGILS